MTVRDLFEKEYGVLTGKIENPLTDTVGTSATQLLLPDAGRLNYTLVNLGATAVLFCFTPDPSVTKGVYVAASGGYVTLDWKDDGLLTTYPIWAISTGATKVFLVGLKIIGTKE